MVWWSVTGNNQYLQNLQRKTKKTEWCESSAKRVNDLKIKYTVVQLNETAKSRLLINALITATTVKHGKVVYLSITHL